jgi:hypothetical protein
MPESISITMGDWLGYATLAAYARSGSGVSAEAAAVRHSARAVVESVERSQALFGGKAAAISDLIALANECAEPGWDGEAAAAIDPGAVAAAENFVRILPEPVPLPEFAPEPDGSVSLDWMHSRYRRFTVSVGGSNRLAFAWLDGTDKGHGVARFDGETIPARILQGIQSIMNHGNSSVRAA